MAKMWSCGYNANGLLGLGNTNSPIYYLTETDLGELSVVKNGYASAYSNEQINVFLMSDGHLYVTGGYPATAASIRSTLTKVFDAVALDDITVMSRSEYNSTRVFGISGDYIYDIYITFTNGEYTATYSLIEDTNYQWSAIGNKKLISTAGRTGDTTSTRSKNKLLLATDDKVYETSYRFDAPIIHNLKAKKVEVSYFQGSAGLTGHDNPTMYVMDSDNYLYAWGSNAYGQCGQGVGVTVSTPTKVLERPIKSFSTFAGCISIVDEDGNLLIWGRRANKFSITDVGVHPTNTDYYDTSPVSVDCKKCWFVGSLSGAYGEDGVFWSLYVQKNDGTLWVNGYNGYGTGSVGNANPINGLVQTSAKNYGNVDVSSVGVSIFVTESDLNLTITVYTPDGKTPIAEFKNVKQISQMSLGGVLPAPMILTDIYGDTYETVINLTTPYQFLGLSYNPNSTEPAINSAQTIPITIRSDTNYYVVLGDLIESKGITINCYNNVAEPIKVNKKIDEDLKLVTTLVGTLRNECSLVDPVITFVSYQVPSFNYVYISDFNRYYFVENIRSDRFGLWTMYLKCDVLNTYKLYIYGLKNVIVERNADMGNQNPLLADPYIRVQENPIIETVEGADIFNPDPTGKCVIVTTVQKSIHYE